MYSLKNGKEHIIVQYKKANSEIIWTVVARQTG